MQQEQADDFDLEIGEWLEALDSLVEFRGRGCAQELLRLLEIRAQELAVKHCPRPFSAYRNSIALEDQPGYPGDLQIEDRITALLRWNALAMVMRANAKYGDLGGHIASYASAAEIFEVGFNHFFRGGEAGDLVFFQPHSVPGIYARAYLEGRLDASELKNFRQEVGGGGLCSYPHPWLMPEFWQFPTGSMGLGPISAIYAARFMRYLASRSMTDTSERHVWGVFGDGEMDEPESICALSLAAREHLGNLTFIINCNLQRLDGPVRGNGQIIQELESTFQGAGWNVVKVLWGSEWDELFARDKNHALVRKFAATVDGKYQTLGAKDGAYNLSHFFQEDPETAALVAHMSNDEIDHLRRGGHDSHKLYAAFAAAKAEKGRPTVILAKTKKGFGMGAAGESRMTAHQSKKLDLDALRAFRDRFALPLSDADLQQSNLYRPAEDSEEIQYLKARRDKLGGYLPARRRTAESVNVPALDTYASFALDAEGKEMSSTMTFVRMLGSLLRDKTLGPRIVPIVADEARTFGMANLFRQIGIYAPDGQLYEPEDSSSLLSYRESKTGQLLEEGISEAGALASWTAAATSYSVHATPMLPVFIYYSMFGFQRVGDLILAAADQRARGFLIGATAGRTTLGGEGLQHQDGSSHLLASAVPNCRAYDPCYAYEIAVLFHFGATSMMKDQVDEFYYLTAMNENYPNPSMPDGVEDDIIKGLYRLRKCKPSQKSRGCVRLLGAGAILREVEAAGELLSQDFAIDAEVFSATSFSQLERDARAIERQNRLHPNSEPALSHLDNKLAGSAPVVAASDYVRAVPNLIAPYVEGRFTALGTDGFGRSDTRTALRRFFEVDRHSIVLAALDLLVREGVFSRSVLSDAINRYQIATETPPPWTA